MNATTAAPTKWILEYWPAFIANKYWNINTLPQWIRWMRFIGTPLILFTGIIGNTLAIIIMLDRSMRRHTYAWYIITLAVCDTAMIGVRLCSWINMISLARGGDLIIDITDDAGCIISEGIPDVFQITGAWMMAIIAAERFSAVWFPSTARKMTPKLSGIVILCVFIFAALSIIYYIIAIRFVDEVNFCAVPYHIGWVAQLYLGFPMEFIPALIIIICNSLVVYWLYRRQHSGTVTSHKRVTFMLLVLTFSFLILTLPAWIFEAIYRTHYNSISKHVEMATREITEFFYQINYCINFFIYVIPVNEFRTVFTQKLRRQCLRKPVSTENDQVEISQWPDDTEKTDVQ